MIVKRMGWESYGDMCRRMVYAVGDSNIYGYGVLVLQ